VWDGRGGSERKVGLIWGSTSAAVGRAAPVAGWEAGADSFFAAGAAVVVLRGDGGFFATAPCATADTLPRVERRIRAIILSFFIGQISDFWAMGKRRPKPKALGVIFNPGAACWRLYSLRSIMRMTLRTNWTA